MTTDQVLEHVVVFIGSFMITYTFWKVVVRGGRKP
jgi:hypothetical protein